MRALEFQYGKDVNFVSIDGSDPKNGTFCWILILILSHFSCTMCSAAKLVQSFGVDGIPHLAFLAKNAEVKTTLVGAVPKQLLVADIDALIKVIFIFFISNIIHIFFTGRAIACGRVKHWRPLSITELKKVLSYC